METSHAFEFFMNHRLSTPVYAEALETASLPESVIQSPSFISDDPRDHECVS